MTRSAAVAAGNADTTAAAAEVLRAGGNAFDAAVAAGFAAAVSEPGMSSLGGGGFLLARAADGQLTAYDFFADAPGKGAPAGRLEPHFLPVTVRFAGADQVFHAGWGSVAVPGCLDGYLHVHGRLGRLPLADVVEPARRLAAYGTVLDAAQGALTTLLGEILTLTPEGRSIFAPRGRLAGKGDRLRNGPLADVLVDVAAGRVTGFRTPALAGPLTQAMAERGGLVTDEDLDGYAVAERDPLRLTYRGADLATNPPPSFGGSLVAAGLGDLDEAGRLDGSPAAYGRLAEALVDMSERHVALADAVPTAVRGTTHVSVVDADGNVAAMTTSNGSCSGVFVPGTGIQLNNVMGEADLHPRGFHVTPPGTRIGSMMTPTVATTGNGTVIGLGSGGSERIRSAITCVLTALLDQRVPPEEAVRAPRLHWDRDALQVEPGLPADAVRRLQQRWPVRPWQRRDLYFGGVHLAARAADGRVTAVGDERRGGVGAVVDVV